MDQQLVGVGDGVAVEGDNDVADEQARLFSGAVRGHLRDQQPRLMGAACALALGQGHGQ